MASSPPNNTQGNGSPRYSSNTPDFGQSTHNIGSGEMSASPVLPHHPEDVEMDDPAADDLILLNHAIGSETLDQDFDMTQEMLVLEPTHPSILTPQRTMSFPSFSSVLQQAESETQRPSNNRRARVDDDHDEERDRRHPSQRINNPVASAPTTPPDTHRTGATPSSSVPQHMHPSSPPSTTAPWPDTPSNPLRFFHHHVSPAPTGASPADQGPTPPTQASEEPRMPPNFIGGITLTLDFSRGTPPVTDVGGSPVTPPQPDLGQGDSQPANATGDRDSPNAQNSPSLADILARVGLVAQMLGGGPSGFREEKEDPERAKKLVAGLEEVPLGLVKRLVRVGGSGGGMGEDESKGGDAGCAICWDSLLLEQESDSTEALQQPKIVSLPCAHVFHADCLVPWFTRPRQTTCPSCRFNIDPDNLTYVSWRQRRREQQERAAAQTNGQNADHNRDSTPPGPSEPPSEAEVPAPTTSTSTTEETPINPRASPPRERLIPIPIVVPITVPATPSEGSDPLPQSQPQAPTTDPPRLPDQPPIPTGSQPSAEIPASANHNPSNVRHFAGDYARFLSRLFSRLPGTGPMFGPPPDDRPSEPSDSNQPASPSTASPPPNPTPTAPNAPRPRTQFGTFDMGNGFQADVLTIGFDVVLGPPIPGPPQTAQAPPRPNPFVTFPQGPPPFGAGLSPPTNPPASGGAGRALDEYQEDVIRERIRMRHGGETQPQGPDATAATPSGAFTVPTNGTHQTPPSGPPPAPQQGPRSPQFLFGGIHFGGGPGNTNGAASGSLSDFFGQLFDQGPPRQNATQGPEGQAPANPEVADPERPSVQPGAAPPTAEDGAGVPPPPRGLLDLLSLFGSPIIITGGGGPGGPGGPGAPPRERQDLPKRPWTPPPAPGPTLRQRIERREFEAGLRCCDMSCGVGPSDEEPELTEAAARMKQLSIKSNDGAEVCVHRFHSSCLVSAERVALQGQNAHEEGGQVSVSCPVCRGTGLVLKTEWDEGVASLA